MVQDSSAALWTALFSRPDVQPGQSLTGFWFEGAGLPTIVSFRVQGRYESPAYNDSLPWLYKEAPSFWENSVGGFTVGLEPVPPNPDLGDQINRLRQLTTRACGELGWISSSTLCTTLSNELAQATQASAQGDLISARNQVNSFTADLRSQHNANATLPVNHAAYALLVPSAQFVTKLLPIAIFLHGNGGTANPPTLSLSTTAPTATTESYKDSPSIAFSGGNTWKDVGTWQAPPAVANGTLSTLADAHVWLGLKNSDDQGTNYDVRVEVAKNGTVITSAQALCVQGVVRPAANAKEVVIPFGAFSATGFNGSSDVLTLKVSTRIGTNGSGALCGGHSNATGLRVYFDATTRSARFDAKF